MRAASAGERGGVTRDSGSMDEIVASGLQVRPIARPKLQRASGHSHLQLWANSYAGADRGRARNINMTMTAVTAAGRMRPARSEFVCAAMIPTNQGKTAPPRAAPPK